MNPNDNSATTVAFFKTLSVLNDGKSTKAGRPIYDDQDVVEIRLAANKQTVGVFPAHEICGWVDGADGTRTQQTYAMKYNAQYLAFKTGEGQTQDGTPLEALTFLTPGKRLELKALNIYTAEALAELDGTPLKRLGMGGRDLKEQAQAVLDGASENRVEKMAIVVSSQDARIAELEAQLAALKPDPLDHDGDGRKGGVAQLPITPAPAQTDTPSIDDVLALATSAHFKTFQSAAGKLLGPNLPSSKADIVAALEALKAGSGQQTNEGHVSPFADFEDDDLRNWLKDAAPTLETSGLDHDELIEAADEVNASLAKQGEGL